MLSSLRALTTRRGCLLLSTHLGNRGISSSTWRTKERRVSSSDFFIGVFCFVLFVSDGPFAPLGIFPFGLHAVALGNYGVSVVDELAQCRGYHHGVDGAVELAVASRLEPPEEEHQLGYLQPVVAANDKIRQVLHLLVGELRLASAELAHVPQEGDEPCGGGVRPVGGVDLAHRRRSAQYAPPHMRAVRLFVPDCEAVHELAFVAVAVTYLAHRFFQVSLTRGLRLHHAAARTSQPLHCLVCFH